MCLAGLDSVSKGSLKGGPGMSLPTFITGLLESWEWRQRGGREKGGIWEDEKEKTHYNSAPT